MSVQITKPLSRRQIEPIAQELEAKGVKIRWVCGKGKQARWALWRDDLVVIRGLYKRREEIKHVRSRFRNVKMPE